MRTSDTDRGEISHKLTKKLMVADKVVPVFISVSQFNIIIISESIAGDNFNVWRNIF
jgi:hypothetical protein